MKDIPSFFDTHTQTSLARSAANIGSTLINYPPSCCFLLSYLWIPEYRFLHIHTYRAHSPTCRHSHSLSHPFPSPIPPHLRTQEFTPQLYTDLRQHSEVLALFFCDWSSAVPVQEGKTAATRCFILRGQRPPRPSPRLQLTGAEEDDWQQAGLRRSESRRGPC